MQPVEVSSYDQLVDMLRDRARELGATREQLDYVAGLPSGYSGKLMGARRVRGLGRVSLGSLLQALGVRLVALPNDQALQQVAHHYGRRQAEPGSDEKDKSADTALTGAR